MASQQDRRKRGLFILLGIVALLLLAAFAAPWLQTWFGDERTVAASGRGSEISSTGGDRTGADSGSEGNGCFLGIICLDASATADGKDVNASANDEGIEFSD
jgi:hypothetical protein